MFGIWCFCFSLPFYSYLVLHLKKLRLLLSVMCSREACVTLLNVSCDLIKGVMWPYWRCHVTIFEGGCKQPCGEKLDCGHFCERSCHFADKSHQEYNCMKSCTKTFSCGHPCPGMITYYILNMLLITLVWLHSIFCML